MRLRKPLKFTAVADQDYRKPGQGGNADREVRDLRAELLRAEAAHFSKSKGGSGGSIQDATSSTPPPPKRQLEGGSATDEESAEDFEAKRRRILEESRDIDADSDSGEGESSEDDRCGRLFKFWF